MVTKIPEQRFAAFVPPGHLISLRVNPVTVIAMGCLELFLMLIEELCYQPRIAASPYITIHPNFPCKDTVLW